MRKLFVKESYPLCRSCQHSAIIESENGEVQMFCFGINRNLNSVPVKCSYHDPFLNSEPFEMTKRAWILQVKGRTVVGFRPPRIRTSNEE